MYLVLLLLAWANEVRAQTIPLKILSEVNNQSVPLCVEDDPMQSCARELCGPPSEAKSMKLTNENFEKHFEKNLTIKDVKLNELVVKMTNYLQEHNQAIEKINQIYKTKKIKFNLKLWDTADRLEIEDEMFKGAFIPKVDPTKPLSDRLSFKIKAPPWTSPDQLPVFAKYAEDLRKKVIADPLKAIQYGLQTPAEITELMKKELSSASDFLKKKGTAADHETWLKHIDREIVKATSAKDYSTISYWFNSLQKIREVIHPETGICESGPCLELMKSYIEKFKLSSLNGLKPLILKPDELKERALRCLSNFILNQERKAKAKSFEKVMPEVIDDFISKAMIYSSQESRLAFRKFLSDEVLFELTNRPKDRDIPIRLADLEKGKSSNKDLRNMWEISRDPFQGMPECASQNKINDQVIRQPSRPTRLQVSYFTCSNHSHGKGVLAHEVGHLLSTAIDLSRLSKSSKEKFLKTRSCLTKRHLSHPAPADKKNIHYPGDTLKTEEDHADFLSAMAIQEGVLHSCSMLPLTHDKLSYDLKLEEDKLDEHSSGFIRILWEAQMRMKALPRVCQKLLKENKNYSMKTCLE